MGAGSQLAVRRRDGSEFPAEISLSALETEDGVLVSAAIRDVTERLEVQAEAERLRAEAERERYESRVHQSQRLESLGQLAGGVAHDFNNLLAVILNYAAFVKEEVGAILDPAYTEASEGVVADLGQIELAAQKATRLTHQLLSFARRDVARPEIVGLNEVITEIHRLLHRTIGEHVELVTSLSSDLWPILADPRTDGAGPGEPRRQRARRHAARRLAHRGDGERRHRRGVRGDATRRDARPLRVRPCE